MRNIAVIGCGYWGRNLVRNFDELGALYAICDSDSEALNRFSLSPNVIREGNFQLVLADKEIRGVVISTPAILHYSMTKQALLAGKDVFVEKPISLKVEEGEELVRIAEEKGRILMVGHILEYHPGVVRLKQLLDEGELGKVNYIYSCRLNLGKFRTEESILWSFGPHDISIILLLLGEMPVEVSAHGGCYLQKDIADVAVATMSFRSGAKAHIFVSWLHPFKEQKLVVIGDKKMAVFDDTNLGNKLQLYNHQVEWICRAPVPLPQKATHIEFSKAEPLGLECQHFLDCLESRQTPKVDGHKGLQVLKILSLCQKSLERNGETISLREGGR